MRVGNESVRPVEYRDMATVPIQDAINEIDDRTKPPFLRRVRIRGYKSIAFCDVQLEPFTILVGRNASGKSNFLDALAFLRDVIAKGAHEAVKQHGGREAILCRLTDTGRIAIEIEAGYLSQRETIPWTARFQVELGIPANKAPQIVREEVELESATGHRHTAYTVENGRVAWARGESFGLPITEWSNGNRVLLGMYGVSPFLELLERLESIQTYNFNPEVIRPLQRRDHGGFLERDGSNLASTIETTGEIDKWAIDRAKRYLAIITNSAEFAGVEQRGGDEALRFRVVRDGSRPNDPLEFDAASMSDGTLRHICCPNRRFSNCSA